MTTITSGKYKGATVLEETNLLVLIELGDKSFWITKDKVSGANKPPVSTQPKKPIHLGWCNHCPKTSRAAQRAGV
jgi:hypothetical protein